MRRHLIPHLMMSGSSIPHPTTLGGFQMEPQTPITAQSEGWQVPSGKI